MYLPTPSHKQDATQGQFFQQFNRFEFRVSFSLTCCHTKAKEPSLLYYLSLTGGRIVRFILFPWLFVQCVMQTALLRVSTRAEGFISNVDNYYTMGIGFPVLCIHFGCQALYINFGCLALCINFGCLALCINFGCLALCINFGCLALCLNFGCLALCINFGCQALCIKIRWQINQSENP